MKCGGSVIGFMPICSQAAQKFNLINVDTQKCAEYHSLHFF